MFEDHAINNAPNHSAAPPLISAQADNPSPAVDLGPTNDPGPNQDGETGTMANGTPAPAQALPDGHPAISDPSSDAMSDPAMNPAVEAMPTSSSCLRAETSRRNGSMSRGPTTEEGKNRSRMNALKHGMRAETLLLQADTAEENAAFEALRACLEEQFPASSIEEQLLLETLVHALWQKQRCIQFEIRELRQELIFHGPVTDRILRYANSADKRFFRTLEELKRLQKQNARPTSGPETSSEEQGE